MQVPAVGDRVRVPWGVDVLDGVVVQVNTTGARGRAAVQVDVPGAREAGGDAVTVTLPVEALQPADWWPDASNPTGGWLQRRASSGI
jgi:hypothetical protein